MRVYLLDEDGKEVSNGEAENSAVKLPYTRRYINLPSYVPK